MTGMNKHYRIKGEQILQKVHHFQDSTNARLLSVFLNSITQANDFRFRDQGDRNVAIDRYRQINRPCNQGITRLNLIRNPS